MKKLAIAVFIFGLFACKNKQKDFEYEIEIFNDTTLVYNFKHKDGATFKIGLYQDDKLHFISNTPSNYTQYVSYFPNGTIQSKIKINQNDQSFGRAYYFYPESGNLEVDCEYKNNKAYGVRIEYYDINTDHIQSIMRFNDEGELKHRLFFDEKGKVTAEEDRERD